MTERIVILDFGSQYTQLIARRIRELGVYTEIHPFSLSLEKLQQLHPTGIVLSGGPSSCYEPGAPTVQEELFGLGVPILAICYGAQLTSKLLGGKVAKATTHEYGRAKVTILSPEGLFAGLKKNEVMDVWMSHGDRVEQLPEGFVLIGQTKAAPAAAFANPTQRIYCVQFHPEVTHTVRGRHLLENFVRHICKAKATWTMGSFSKESIAEIQAKVGANERVICALSGGVDSSVACALVQQAIGERLSAIFVDNGLLRQGERAQVEKIFKDHFKADLHVVDASERFLTKLKGVTDPEKKRKIIGHEFIAVFDEESAKIGQVNWLVQGTLYPDVIESVSFKGPSATIKSHHNVGGLPEHMKLKLVEPLRELFKDEVRALGEVLGLPHDMVWRQPFPGPGLAIRCLGEVTKERLDVLRRADAIIDEEIRAAGFYEKVWQSFGVLLPVKSVGVMGDARTYAEALALRVVNSTDGMTADWVELPHELLSVISNRIINEVRGINRVTYDISSKPPGTIEWE